MKKIKLFVYGSLKNGFFLHHRLQGAILLDKYHTVEGLTLYSLRDSYPVAIFKNYDHIVGELYLVSEDVFELITDIEFRAGYSLATIGDDVYFFIMDSEYRDYYKKYYGKHFYRVGPEWKLGYRPKLVMPYKEA